MVRTSHSSDPDQFTPRGDLHDAAAEERAREADAELVAELLGRAPSGRFSVAVRRLDGTPAVIENAPLLDDGRPMPTRYWLVDLQLRVAVSTLESAGGVRRAEEEVDELLLCLAHERYAAERDARLAVDHEGPRPSGGVGGTRRGVKCLHAHLAWFMAGGDDPVGRWVAENLGLDLSSYTRTGPHHADTDEKPR